MSILARRDTRVIVQGITGREGAYHTQQMLAYGTRVAAGVTPGKGGTFTLGKIPVFNTVSEAVGQEGGEATVLFVPALAAANALIEAAAAGLKLLVCITEGIPVRDMVRVHAFLRRTGSRLVGPNSPGLIIPGQCKLGIMPGAIHRPGRVGVVSRSGTLTYEAVAQLSRAGLGQSACLGLGGDPLPGLRFKDALALFQEDPETEAVVLIGEIGGTDEEDAADYLRSSFTKPLAAYIAGQSAPAEKRLGHSGAIISRGQGGAAEKIRALAAAGAHIIPSVIDIGSTVKNLLDFKP